MKSSADAMKDRGEAGKSTPPAGDSVPAADPPGPEGLAPEAAELFVACEFELASGLALLPDHPGETVTSTLAALWHAAAGRPLSVRLAAVTPLPALDKAGASRLRELVRRRLDGVPLAHLTGRQRFMGLELHASAEALIPREETELLGRAALERLRTIIRDRDEALVIDACTGSGNLALALAWHEPRAKVWGADISREAIAIARRNATQLGIARRVSFRVGDLLAPFETPEFPGRVDLLVCNPPYISSAKVDGMHAQVADHEPRLAFDGGPFGIRILQRVVNEAPRLLRAGGTLAFEVGQGQGLAVRRRLERSGRFVDVAQVLDKAGHVRVLMARLEPEAGTG
jgi:release factor glutamine methyltransferase